MADGALPKKNTAYTFTVALVSQANTKIMAVNPTLAAGDVKVSIDGANESNITTLPTVINGTAMVKVSLSAVEMNGNAIAVQFTDAAGAEWCDLHVTLQTATSATADLSTLAAGAEMDLVAAPNATAVTAIQAGLATTVNVSAVETDTQDIQSRLPAALVNSRMDATIDGTGMEATAVAAIWDALTSSIATAGSIGKLIVDKLTPFNPGQATFIGPVITAGTAEIVPGDDYHESDGTEFTWTWTDATASYIGAAATFYAEKGGTSLSKLLYSLSESGGTVTAKMRLTATESADLLANTGKWSYQVRVTFSSGRLSTKVSGTLSSKDRIGT